MNFYFVTIHYKSRISEDFGDFQYTSLLGAYDLTTGITTSVFHESKINQKIIENSSTLIVVCDYRKIGHQANFTIGKIEDIDILITDSYADERILTALEKSGVQVIQVQI